MRRVVLVIVLCSCFLCGFGDQSNKCADLARLGRLSQRQSSFCTCTTFISILCSLGDTLSLTAARDRHPTVHSTGHVMPQASSS